MALRGIAKQVAASALHRYFPKTLLRYYLYTHSHHCEPEIWLVPALLSGKGIALDIGANAGLWALQLARYARHVQAFEPNPICQRQLERVLPSRVTLNKLALSDQSGGTVAMRFDPENTGIGTIAMNNPLVDNPGIKTIETIQVPIKRLDDFGFEDVEFVKIDVEGHEEAVLAGALETIRMCRPAVVCEIEERHNPGGLARIRRLFGELGYSATALNGGVLQTLEHIERGPGPTLGHAGGINNFVFLDEARARELLSPKLRDDHR